MALDFSNYNYLEKIDPNGASPSRGSFAFERSQAQLPIIVENSRLEEAIVEILGSVEPSGTGGLKRTLPRAHPRFSGLFATSISSVQGLGVGALYEVDEPVAAEAPRLVNARWEWDYWLVGVNFEALPYALLQDETIEEETFSYYAEDDTGVGSGTSMVIPAEWRRFVDVEIVPSFEVQTAQAGGLMKFRRQDAAAPNGNSFAGFVSMTIPKGTVKIKWFRVPESYIASANSPLRTYVGKINQVQLDVGIYSFSPGTLLYTGFNSRRYTPPLPETSPWDGTIYLEKVVDLELNFLLADREVTSAPTLTNRNWIAAGHNTMPDLASTRKFCYVSADKSTAATQYPLFGSRIFQNLFMDPNA